MSREPFFDQLAIEYGRLLHHRHYNQHPNTTTTPATTITTIPSTALEAHTMAIADIHAALDDLANHARQIETETLPAAIGDLQRLEPLIGNPAADALLNATHVPPAAIAAAIVPVIQGLEALYKPTEPTPPAETAAPAEPAPAEATEED